MSLAALALVASSAQAKPHHRHRHVVKKVHVTKSVVVRNGAENSLIGVHLFDSCEKLLHMFGSPNELIPLNMGGAASSGGFSGGGSGFGAPGGPGGVGRQGGPGSSSDRSDVMTPEELNSEFEFGDSFLQGGLPPSGGSPPGRGPGGPGRFGGPPVGAGGAGGGRPGGPGGRFGGGRFGGGAGGGGGSAPVSGGAAESVTYTRWVYNRDNNKFGFIVNRLGQIIQLEAIGLSNPKVKTRRGIGFGSEFKNVLEAYHNPDGYEIGGDTILVKYLVNDKVAFRLTRLGDKKPHEVTGIVISAGKG